MTTEPCDIGFTLVDDVCVIVPLIPDPPADEFVIATWDNITPDQYETSPFTTGWPWCEPGTFPQTYEWEAPCGPDPCQPFVVGDGVVYRTMWNLTECVPPVASSDVEKPEAVTATVAIDTPPMLPATGADPAIVVAGVVTLLAGIVLFLLAKATSR